MMSRQTVDESLTEDESLKRIHLESRLIIKWDSILANNATGQSKVCYSSQLGA